MFILEIDWAIYKRLTGFPLDNLARPLLDSSGVPKNREVIGPPAMMDAEREWDPVKQEFYDVPNVLPSYGIRIPVSRSPVANEYSSNASAAQGGLRLLDPIAMRQIPVFDENMVGRKNEDVWPCVTFRWEAIDFDPSAYVYADPYFTPDTSRAPVNILNQKGEIVQTGYDQGFRRPKPDSWPLTYAITAYARNSAEIALISNEIIRMFPAKGGLTVEQASGDQHTCDMLLLRTETQDERSGQTKMTQGSEQNRSYARAFYYLVEGYIDNTANKYGVQDTRTVPTVRERILELDRIMGDLSVRESESSLNAGLLKPVTQ